MEENETVKKLQQTLSKRIQQCSDMRTLIEVLELLEDDHPQKGWLAEDAPTIVEEPQAPYGYSQPMISERNLEEAKRRVRDHEAGNGNSLSWDELEREINNKLEP